VPGSNSVAGDQRKAIEVTISIFFWPVLPPSADSSTLARCKPDNLSYVLYDKTRNRLYLSAGDHIDVFALGSNTFATALHPPALGTSRQFQGLALTPDGKYLLAADLLDGSLAVVDPDVPSKSYAVSVAASSSFQGCAAGPLFVGADNQGRAFVSTGGVVGTTGCGPGGQTYTVNLTTRSSSIISLTGCTSGSAYISSTADGSVVAFGNPLQLFSTTEQRCLSVPSSYMQYGIASAGDGNIFATLVQFVDASGHIVGRMGHPTVLYPSPSVYYNFSPYENGVLQNPALNDSGSLYYWAYPDHIDIVDVQHGMSLLRFSLTEKVRNAVAPMAIDGGGQHIYLITDKGLTVVDLGNAPLSVGHLSQTTAAVGSQVLLRGSGFENGVSVLVGTQAANVTYTDANTLTFSVPPTDAGVQDISLKNQDGTSTS
jgi:hypothetical protein